MIINNCHRFENKKGVPFVARLVAPGMGYGAFRDHQWRTTNDMAECLVSFHDERFAMTPHGQLVSTYFLSTLLINADRNGGILLDTGSPGWEISGDDVQAVIAALSPVASYWDRQAAQGLTVTLANGGNPDMGQDPGQPLLHAPDDTRIAVHTLHEASALCRTYIDSFGLGAGNWSGGQVHDEDGALVASVSYNGRVFSPADELMEEAARLSDYAPFPIERFFHGEQDQSQLLRPLRQLGRA